MLHYSALESQLGWFQLMDSSNTTTVSYCQTSSNYIPGDEPQQGIDGYERENDRRQVPRMSITVIVCPTANTFKIGTIVVKALINTTTASDCQTSTGKIPGDKPQQGTDGYERENDRRQIPRMSIT